MRRCSRSWTPTSAPPTSSCATRTAAATSPSRCAPRPPPRTCPMPRFAGQQETFLNVTGADDVVHKVKEVFASPLQRPRHRLPRAPRLQARGRVPVRRRAADGALRRRLLRRAVHARHRVGLPRRGVHHLQLRPGRDGRAGRGQSGRVLRLQADPAQGKPAILRRSLGAKQHAHGVFGRSPASACASRTRRPTCATRFSISDDDVHELAQAGAGHREALRPPDGHRVGEGRRQRQALHRAGAPGNGEVARPRPRRSSATSSPSAAR